MKPSDFGVVYAHLSNEFVDKASGECGKNSRRFADARRHTPVEHCSVHQPSGKFFKLGERAVLKGQ